MKLVHRFILFLLCLLLSAPAFARTVRLRYWFDGEVQKAQTEPFGFFAGDEAEIMLDTHALSVGLHTLYVQVSDPDGKYSPLVSGLFFKPGKYTGKRRIRYWFDDQSSSVMSLQLPAGGDTRELSYLIPTDKLSTGIHRLTLQAENDEGVWSTTLSALFVKTPQGGGSPIRSVRYWIDDNLQTAREYTFAEACVPGQVYELDLKLNHVSKGRHKLSLATLDEDGILGNVSADSVYVTTGLPDKVQAVRLSPDPNALVPAEVSKGATPIYHFRIVDEQQKPVEGIALAFECSVGNVCRPDLLTTSYSDSVGIVSLAVPTSGPSAVAERGETISLQAKQAQGIGGNQIALTHAVEPVSFRIRKGSFLFENIEEAKLILKAKGKAKSSGGDLNGSLGNSFSCGLKWDNAGKVKSLLLDYGLEGSIGVDIKAFHLSPSLSVKGTNKIEISLANPRKAIPLTLVKLAEAGATIKLDPALMLAIRTLSEWMRKNGGYQEVVLKEETGGRTDFEIGFSLKWGSLFGNKALRKIPSWRLPTKLDGVGLEGGFGAKAKASWDFLSREYNPHYGQWLDTDGRSMSFNLEAEGALISKLLVSGKGLGFNSWHSLSNALKGESLFQKYKTKLGLKLSYGMDFSEKESFYQQKRISVASGLNTKASAKLSLKDIPALGGALEKIGSVNAAIALSMKNKHRLSSRGKFVELLEKDALQEGSVASHQLFPTLQGYILNNPLDHLRIWNEKTAETKTHLLSGIDSYKDANLKEDLKVSEKIETGIEISGEFPVFKTTLLTLSVEATLGLETTTYPSESYYSVPDRRFYPVLCAPQNGILEVGEGIVEKLSNAVRDVFDKKKMKEELDEEARKYTDYKTAEVGAGSMVRFTNERLGHQYVPIMKRYRKFSENPQKDISTMTFDIAGDNKVFDNDTQLSFHHFYPAGELYSVTDQADTLLVLSEVFYLRANYAEENLLRAPRGAFSLNSRVGRDDLLPFGLAENIPIGVYYCPEGNRIWRYLGEAGKELSVDSLGMYMLATSLRGDQEPPQLTAVMDSERSRIELTITDNVGVRMSSLQLFINGLPRKWTHMGGERFALELDDSDRKQKELYLSGLVFDLAGNKGFIEKKFVSTENISTPTADMPSYSCYPNPAKSSITLQTSASAVGLPAVVYTLNGERRLSFRIESPIQRLDIGQLEDGMYFLYIEGYDRPLKFVVLSR